MKHLLLSNKLSWARVKFKKSWFLVFSSKSGEQERERLVHNFAIYFSLNHLTIIRLVNQKKKRSR